MLKPHLFATPILAFALAGAAAACTAEEAPADETATASSADGPTPATPGGTTHVEVATEGTKFDPPVTAARIPPGAWMCDMMGKVHYAAMQKGDGKCPTCGMALTQASTATEQGHDGHGTHGHAQP